MKQLIAIVLVVRCAFAFDLPIAWDKPADVTTQAVTNQIVFQGATNYVIAYPNISGYIIFHSTDLSVPFVPVMTVSALATNVTLTNLTDVNHFVYMVSTNPVTGLVSNPSNLINYPKGSTNGAKLNIPGF